MLNKKSFLILSALSLLIITSLFGCGGQKGSATADTSTGTSTTPSTSNTGAQLESISVTPTNPTMAVGSEIQLTATGYYSDNTSQDLTSTVTWTSSAADAVDVASGAQVAQFTGFSSSANNSGTVLPPGHIKATGTGKAKITATLGDISGTTTLTVTEGAAVTLSWDAPTTNTDGSPLNPATDLSLYKIYYGTVSHTYTTVVNITNPGTTTISQTLNLLPGTYYFVVTTVNASGQESGYSDEVMRTI